MANTFDRTPKRHPNERPAMAPPRRPASAVNTSDDPTWGSAVDDGKWTDPRARQRAIEAERQQPRRREPVVSEAEARAAAAEKLVRARGQDPNLARVGSFTGGRGVQADPALGGFGGSRNKEWR
jgi:hypothetical protein